MVRGAHFSQALWSQDVFTSCVASGEFVYAAQWQPDTPRIIRTRKHAAMCVVTCWSTAEICYWYLVTQSLIQYSLVLLIS